jgi:SHS2 domain-containing protein
MAHDWVEHTGELALDITAGSEAGVFEEGFAAMRELLACEGHTPGRRSVTLKGRDRAVLLADWLAELAVLAETEGLVPERLTRLEVGDDYLHAQVEGRHGAPVHLVKAVTYHQLEFERVDDGWRASVVLDV